MCYYGSSELTFLIDYEFQDRSSAFGFNTDPDRSLSVIVDQKQEKSINFEKISVYISIFMP